MPESRPLGDGDPTHIRPISNTPKKNEYDYQSAFKEYNQGTGHKAKVLASIWAVVGHLTAGDHSALTATCLGLGYIGGNDPK